MAAANGCTIVRTFEGLGQSATGDDLAKRPGLREAVAMIEAGEADVIVSAYFDRFFRNLSVQAEVLKRIEAAGGQVLAGDAGQISHATAAQWLSATAMGMIAEYVGRSIKERTGAALKEHIAQGGTPTTPPTGYRSPVEGERGYQRGAHAELIEPAFRRRVEQGLSYAQIAAWLGEQGLSIAGASVGRMMKNRAYLGEYTIGEVTRAGDHEALVPEELFAAAQRRTGAKRAGRNPILDTLLLNGTRALICSSCGRWMTGRHVASTGQLLYVCQGDVCSHRMAITARAVDAWVSRTLSEAVRGHQAGQAGTNLDALAAKASAARDALLSHVRNMTRFGLAKDPEALAIGDELSAAVEAAERAVTQARRGDALAAFDPATIGERSVEDQRLVLVTLGLRWEVLPSNGRKGPGTDVTRRLRRL